MFSFAILLPLLLVSSAHGEGDLTPKFLNVETEAGLCKPCGNSPSVYFQPTPDHWKTQFTGCDCPKNYGLVISTSSTPYQAYCQRICIDQSVNCSSLGDYGFCLGDTIALGNCTAAAALGPIACNGACAPNSSLLVIEGTYACFGQSGTIQSGSPLCPTGYNTQCVGFSNSDCSSFTGIVSLLSIPCSNQKQCSSSFSSSSSSSEGFSSSSSSYVSSYSPSSSGSDEGCFSW